MSTSSSCNCSTETDALSNYESLYPKSFIECIREGCTWLANHNNITYQTSILVRTDSTIYSKSGSSIIKLGLIDSDKPTTGLTEYDVLSVTEAKDTVNGSTIYNVKCSYKTPMGINLTLIPINYVDPKKEDTNRCYSVAEVNALIAGLEDKINASKTDTSSDIIGQTIDKYLNIKLADYTLTSYLEQQISVLNNKIANMSVGGGVDLSEYAKTTEVETKIQTAIADIPATDLSNYATKAELTSKVDTATLANYPTKSEVTTQIAASATGGQVNLDGYVTTDALNAAIAGQDFSAYATVASVETKADKTALDAYVKTETLTTDYQTTAIADSKYATITSLNTKANIADVYTKSQVYNKNETYDKTEIDNLVANSADIDPNLIVASTSDIETVAGSTGTIEVTIPDGATLEATLTNGEGVINVD